jgi:glyoxylase-like metal-dependent hydrolase (beta-lactamase superfamily II)
MEVAAMTAIRQPGKINQNTTLIDIGMQGIYGMTAVYLVRADKTCLIDGGTHTEAGRLLKALRELDAFPPDLIIVTHPHWDHSQGIPFLRREAARQSMSIQVMACDEAVPLLADATFNDVLRSGPYQSIQNVTPVSEGDVIDLGGLTLRIYEVPGHCKGHIAILDQKNRNIFVGDALGIKLSDTLILPPFIPPTWNPDAFLSSVSKLSQVPYDTLCLAHFGLIGGTESRAILAEAVETCSSWWRWYGRHAGRLDDTAYLLRAMREEINPSLPVVKPVSIGMGLLLALISTLGALTGRKTAIIDRLAFGHMLQWLAMGYEMSAEG